MKPNLQYFSLLFLLCVKPGIAGPRIDCLPEPSGNQTVCESRGCIWNPVDNDIDGAPWCYFKDGVGYNLASQIGSTYNLRKNNGPRNPWGAEFENIQLRTSTIGASVLNVKIGIDGRYEPPVDFPRETISTPETLSFTTASSDDLFWFSVIRNSSNRKIFDTSLGGLIFSDQFLQLSTYLPSENVYGWGENAHQSLKHNFSRYLTWGMLARDQPPNSGNLDTMNLYGVHPFYMCLEPDGNAHGVFIFNSNPQEVTTAPGPSLIYRTIGGNLDIYFFPGPTPALVTQQYLAFIGKPFLPAYWALGYQLSRYGYNGLDEMKQRVGAVRDAGIPLDIAVADIDYMNRYKDFSTNDNWSGFEDYVKQMHGWNMKMIPIFDPAVEADYLPFQRAMSMGAKFIEWDDYSQVQQDIQKLYPMAKDTKIMLGVVWPDHHVGFPDFLDSTGKTQAWWRDELELYHSKLTFDGIWIDMNEPANFGTNELHPWYFDDNDHPNDAPLFCPTNGSNQWDLPPFQTHAVYYYGGNQNNAYLSSKTLCLTGVQNNGTYRFYDVKNLYGLTEAIQTQAALMDVTGKRGAVVSRSTFPSAGRYAGHWLGDNTARWEDLRTSVIGAQEFNLFGIPYVGSDVCGFLGQSNEELCLRWQQMGAFHSFFRNHNTLGEPAQDPAVWPSVASATKTANLFRYQYLPYLFSLHFQASQNGLTVVRPVFFEYPSDTETFDLGYQFMWGPRILVAPVLHQGAVTTNLYLPNDVWYSLFDYKYGSQIDAGYITVPSPITYRIPVFVRGGSAVPRQTPTTTTTMSRHNSFELLVAPCQMGRAVGVLYWDDGQKIVDSFDTHDFHQFNFNFNSTSSGAQLTISRTRMGTVALPTMDIIEIFNYPSPPNFRSFTLNGSTVNINVQSSTYSGITKILYISTKNLIDLTSSDVISLVWSNVLK
ncbi:hypothetical protein L5515_005679 [Caenorhabditis briggsae]|uniref:P-type domain-containing protein n=1 Tax=Caenorhabditis briggsae TaxID=6238 RepID=A0AAE9CXN9_CAEBR|nr:hypothetical protein L3Y34_005859 [Caenorhabditis briggsae]UMM31506.1 hypothetical protein L5515_005679 [Caenorhabditis briggsae]